MKPCYLFRYYYIYDITLDITQVKTKKAVVVNIKWNIIQLL